MRRRLLGFLVAALLLLALFASSAAAFPLIMTAASESANGEVTFSWYEGDLPNPGYDFAGYDIWRRALDDCSGWERVNAEIYPRGSGTSIPDGHNGFRYQHVDHPPTGHSYEYRVRFVDANRQEVSPGPCECTTGAYVSTPGLTIPITQGRLVDWGWAGFIEPCLGSCLPSAYISPLPPELAPYVGTNTTLRFYGRVGCGSVEGCSMVVDHFEVASCEIVPTRRTSWGLVKTIYR
jgi:hypothetical protein